MSDAERPVSEPHFIDAPHRPHLRALYDYWDRLRGGHGMPRRADFDPVQIPRLLPYLVLYGVEPDGGYTIRLVGEEIVGFVGRNAAGHPAGSALPAPAAVILTSILNAVVAERAPKFRLGKAHWQPDKSYREFEACFLPLSPDGEQVEIIICGIGFSDYHRPEI